MIDFLKLEKHFTDKGKPFLGLCTKTGDTFSFGGWEWFKLQGQHPIKIGWCESRHLMKVEGSLSYFSQGHNFSFSDENLVNAVNFLCHITQCSLWDSEVTELEFGKIIPTQFPAADYIKNTSPIKGYSQTQAEKFFKRFKARFLDMKIYDAGRNILEKQGINDRQVIIQQGWNPDDNFLKVEAHYYKPWKALNDGREIKLAELLLPDFIDRMKEDLFLHYDRLHKMKTIITPDNKKDLSAASIILMALAESESEKGKTLADLKAELYRRIDTLPALTKDDAKARKKQVKNWLDKFELAPSSKWDISEELAAALNQ